MLKSWIRWCRVASILVLAGLMITPPMNAGDSAQSFRQQNGLLTLAPPAWFLEGYFVARDPRATEINIEVAFYVKSEELARKVIAYMDEGVLPENS